jgi:cyanate lyase
LWISSFPAQRLIDPPAPLRVFPPGGRRWPSGKAGPAAPLTDFPSLPRFFLLFQPPRGNTMSRLDVTEKIISTKVSKGLSWADVAKKVGQSKEWTTALCLGQMTATPAQAKVLGKIFGLSADEQKWLMVVPYKGSLPTSVPTDPLIYRFYELVSVYGTTFKELIHEEFGDGIMSAIDFKMDLQRQADPNGDRVNIVMSGKFLPYKQY